MPSKTALSCATAIICTLIVAGTALVWHGNGLTEFAMLVSFIPTTIASILAVKASEEVKAAGNARAETLERIEKNTNGTLTTLLNKIPDNGKGDVE